MGMSDGEAGYMVSCFSTSGIWWKIIVCSVKCFKWSLFDRQQEWKRRIDKVLPSLVDFVLYGIDLNKHVRKDDRACFCLRHLFGLHIDRAENLVISHLEMKCVLIIDATVLKVVTESLRHSSVSEQQSLLDCSQQFINVFWSIINAGSSEFVDEWLLCRRSFISIDMLEFQEDWCARFHVVVFDWRSYFFSLQGSYDPSYTSGWVFSAWYWAFLHGFACFVRLRRSVMYHSVIIMHL
jgi:hypothetical protein